MSDLGIFRNFEPQIYTMSALVASRLANMPLGGAIYRSANLQTDKVSQPEAAKMLNVYNCRQNQPARMPYKAHESPVERFYRMTGIK